MVIERVVKIPLECVFVRLITYQFQTYQCFQMSTEQLFSIVINFKLVNIIKL